MTNVWYNTYRPKKFDDVIGQPLVKKVLQNAISTNRIKNGYLLSGSRGVGKTTLARIFANDLNKIALKPDAKIDIFEMDAASNTSVDDIRLLIENASTPPLVGEYKIFIIDEVHMLSKSAMNALLKILEEPPVYLVFIFATTNPEKILPTVLSRLIKLDLQDHSEVELIENLESISKKEDVKIDNDALKLIAKKANGGQRDAINYLQTVSEYNLDSYSSKEVASILGVMPDELILAMIYAVKSNKVPQEYKKELISNFNKLQVTPVTAINQLLEFVLDNHFNGDASNSDLIPVLRDYIIADLPVNNLIEVFAYLDYNYPNKIQLKEVPLIKIDALDLKKNLETPDQIPQQQSEIPFNEIESTIQASDEVEVNYDDYLLDEYKYDEEKVESVDTSPTTEEAVTHNSEEFRGEIDAVDEVVEVKTAEISDLESIDKILQNLNRDKKAPTNLLSAAKSLKIKELNGNLELDVTDSKFYYGIKNEELEYLKNKINTLLGTQYELTINPTILEFQKQKAEALILNTTSEETIKPTISEKIVAQDSILVNQQTQTKINNTEHQVNHFYKVFGSRPENVPEGIQIIKDLPTPKNKAENPDSSDDGIHDLFDI
ncbi:MAG: DNA polymerase III subunit gamma/tau [Patescibacteria group bacterium]